MHNPKRILCFGAHPDDVEWGMAGTLLKMKKAGFEIFIVDLTRGEAAKTGTPEERYIEAERAATLLGAHRSILNLGDKKLQPDRATAAIILSLIREIQPQLIYAPHWEDRHSDHAAVGKLLKPYASAFYLLRTQAEPSHAVDISEVIEEKKEILWQHTSQLRESWEPNFVKKHENAGKQIKARFAEAFVTNEELQFLKQELPEFL